MAEDWYADVLRYDPEADAVVVDKIVKHCGIALRTRDASLVSFSDTKETDRVRESFLKKKLALADDDATLDAAIAAVGERMKADHDKNRVTVYYLLTQHFGRLEVFGAVSSSATAAAVAAGAAAAASTGTAAPTTPPMAAMSSAGGGSGGAAAVTSEKGGGDKDIWGFGCLAGVVVLGAILVGAIVSVWASNTILYREPEPVAAPAPPPPPPEPAVPEGAGVTATERNGMPMLTVYFDTGSSDVTPDFETVSSDLRAYLDDNPDATVQISGYNDPTGDAEINAALSRDRAMNVQSALTALGIAEERTDLVRPDDTTTTDMTPAEARRVEITVVE